MNKEALYRFVGLKEGEDKTVGLFIGYSFFMGVAVAIFYTATTSLFLITFDRTMLPKAYIAGGITVYLLGTLTSYLEKKIRFTRLVNVLIYFLMASVTGLLISYQFSEIKWFIFFLFVWNRVFVFVNGITFWSTAAKIFNIQQAKRLFGLIGAGEVVSSILSYFSVPLLLKLISTNQLLYIASAAIVGCIVLMAMIIKRFSAQLTQKEEVAASVEKPKNTQSWKDFLANPYYLMVFLLAMLPVVGLFFVDFMFAIESKKVFPDKELLASFLGVFFGFCALVEILIKTVLYGKAMSKYGLKIGITLLPLALLFSTALAVSYGVVYGTTSLFFAFIVLSRFFMSSVRKSVNEPSFQVLLQPIPTLERAALQSRIEGGPKALGNIVPGVILLVLTSFSFVGTVHIATFFIIILIAWFYVSLKTYSRYRAVLNTLLEKSQTWVSKRIDAYSSISQKLKAEKKNLSLSHEYSNFDFIKKLIESSKEQDRLLAAQLLGESGRYFAFRYLNRLINDESEKVKEEAIRAAGSVQKVELWPSLISNLNSDRFHQAAAYALLRIGEPVVRELGRSFTRSAGQKDFQLRLLRVIRQIGGDDAIKFFRTVMNYPDLLVRDEVYEALKHLNYQARITERGYIASEIDNRIELLVWIMASQRDLEHYPPWSPIQAALEKEKLRVIPKIFTLLSLFNKEQHFDFICDLLVRDQEETYGYLLEVMNMALPAEWKDKVITLFDDRPLAEKLRLSAEYYPQSHLTPEQRLQDIVNKNFSRVSRWLKATALKELAHLETDNTLIFAAHAISPDEIISEIALSELYRLNPDRFHELLGSMEAGHDAFHKQIATKITTLPEVQDYMIHKVWVLSQVDLFSGYHEDELISLTCTLDRYTLSEGQSISQALLTRFENSLLIVAVGEAAVQKSDGTSALLGPFDVHNFSSSNDLPVSIQAIGDSEIYRISALKVAGLRLVDNVIPEVPRISESETVE